MEDAKQAEERTITRTDVERTVLANVETTDRRTSQEAEFEKEMASFVESSTGLPDLRLPAHEQYQLRLAARDPHKKHNKLGPAPDFLPAKPKALLPGKASGEDVSDLTVA